MTTWNNITSRAPRDGETGDLTRRLRRGTGHAVAMARYALAPQAHGFRNEFAQPMVARLTLRWPDLPADLHGLRIAQISDMHAAPWMPVSLLRRGAALALAEKPDLIALTGDFITLHSYPERFAGRAADALARLRAPLGVYASLGNHDYWGSAPAVTRALARVGIPTLVNAATTLRIGAADLVVAGLDSAREGQPDLRAALDGTPRQAFRVLLAHEPDVADRAAGFGVHLQLSGHSHGGQIEIPGVKPFWLPRLGKKYPRGLYRVLNMWLYTNRGLGGSFPPVRHNCPPEVTLITLERDACDASS